mgnify:CR=1 FL=1
MCGSRNRICRTLPSTICNDAGTYTHELFLQTLLDHTKDSLRVVLHALPEVLLDALLEAFLEAHVLALVPPWCLFGQDCNHKSVEPHAQRSRSQSVGSDPMQACSSLLHTHTPSALFASLRTGLRAQSNQRPPEQCWCNTVSENLRHPS